jgi:hypothetical protein
MNFNKIALGTAQFGLNYGVKNTTGKVKKEDIESILSLARDNNINIIDTAISYGTSEKILGEIGVVGWKIVSKIPQVPSDCIDINGWFKKEIQASLRRLNLSSIYAVLLHKPMDLLTSQGKDVFLGLVKLKEQGLVKKVGISVYDPKELDEVWKRYNFDIVQLPYNIIDRRMLTSGWLRRLYESGVEVHSRSAFLQGLLLMNQTNRPPKYDKWEGIWRSWDNWLKVENLDALDACLRFVLNEAFISHSIIGVDSFSQFKQIIKTLNFDSISPPTDLFSYDEELINPANW